MFISPPIISNPTNWRTISPSPLGKFPNENEVIHDRDNALIDYTQMKSHIHRALKHSPHTYHTLPCRPHVWHMDSFTYYKSPYTHTFSQNHYTLTHSSHTRHTITTLSHNDHTFTTHLPYTPSLTTLTPVQRPTTHSPPTEQIRHPLTNDSSFTTTVTTTLHTQHVIRYRPHTHTHSTSTRALNT